MMNQETKDFILSKGFSYNGQDGMFHVFSGHKKVLTIGIECSLFRVNGKPINTNDGVHRAVVKYFEEEKTFCQKVKELFK